MNPFSQQGRALPMSVREGIVELRLKQKWPSEIVLEFKLPLCTVHNIIEKFLEH
jgi:hypothetical protein